MPRNPDFDYHRSPDFLRAFADEAARMHTPPAEKPPAVRDEAVLLPILLLLLREGADRWLLLALLYILL